ncbi:MAG: MerR family transcriptional regulator [Lachnospiraceae bacterium]|nr:MerR family transcriptional regulator [Lachnospiraceae bacterium]
MLRIGEFAQLSSISIHMLRHYDKIGLLCPRHVDGMNGYRYYDKEQLVQANQIIALKTMGFGLDEIKDVMSEKTEDVNDFLHKKLQDKYKEMNRIKEQITQIQGILNTNGDSEQYALQIARKTMESMWVACLHGEIASYPDEGILWGRLTRACRDCNIPLLEDSPAMAIYHGTIADTGMMSVDVLFPLNKEYKGNDSFSIRKIPAQDVVSAIFKGSYSQIYSINLVVAKWLEKNHLAINGQCFTIYHNSPGNCKDDGAFITELCFPVQEKRD